MTKGERQALLLASHTMLMTEATLDDPEQHNENCVPDSDHCWHFIGWEAATNIWQAMLGPITFCAEQQDVARLLIRVLEEPDAVIPQELPKTENAAPGATGEGS